MLSIQRTSGERQTVWASVHQGGVQMLREGQKEFKDDLAQEEGRAGAWDKPRGQGGLDKQRTLQGQKSALEFGKGAWAAG